MELIQKQDQGLCWALSLYLRLPGVNFAACASAIWSNWSVLVAILLILKEVWSFIRACFCSVLRILWSWQTHLDDCPWFASFGPLSSCCPYLACMMLLLFFSIFLLSSLVRYLIGIWAGEAVSRGCVQVRICHVSPRQTWVWGCLVSGTLWAACDHLIIRLSWASNETQGRAGGLLSLSPWASSSFQC